jgi:hypothetical protein
MVPKAGFVDQRWVTLFVRQNILQGKILSEAMRPGGLIVAHQFVQNPRFYRLFGL